ncbi:hypothetical protein H9638_00520 [Arthrobacter sp. Sa2BUA2]|uniref:DUF4129 domain-containing protein n=1 Tax=Arthrobacter pullicola TaxID=2762224 RepID=A0ABR8YDJ1_9MICC|nr:hypothetical protein [Arthrobacter pullicola]MBD8042286.1 hypothetical protein [Arthrobacter pullicola]
MPGVDGSLLAAIPAILLAAAAVLFTAPALDAALRRDDGERLFWVGFTGLLTGILAVAWAGLAGTGAAAATGLLLVAGSAGAWIWLRRRHRARKQARAERIWAKRLHGLDRRREAILREWSSYELDPWKGVEYPGLGDVREAETSRLARASRDALAAQEAARVPSQETAALSTYAAAVDRLEEAWEAARHAARRRAG